MKSELEKEAILNSYKIFLKTINHNIQILIQSKKEDISKHVSSVNFQKQKESQIIQDVSQKYIEYIMDLNKKKKSATKNFYLVLESKNYNKDIEDFETIACDELNENYLKIKDCLSRCGNSVQEVSEKVETIKILFSFLNTRKNLSR